MTTVTEPGAGGIRPGPPARREPRKDGMIVALQGVHGYTDPRVLQNPFYFQCAPLDTMPQDYTWQWDDYTTVAAGMHSNPVAPGLASWTFDTLFVDRDSGGFITLTGFLHPLALLKALKQLGDSMTPFQLQFGQPSLWGLWDVVSGATLRALHVEERAGEVDARYLTVTFTEYPDMPSVRPLPPRPVSGGGNTGAAGKPTSSNPQGSSILAILDSSKLKANANTMAKLAKIYYGSAAAWRLIAKASGLTTIGPNVNLVTSPAAGKHKPPARIVIPRRT